MKSFGEWLISERKKKTWSQDDLADRAGVSKNYISRLERNLPDPRTGAQPQPSRKVVEAIAAALGWSPEEPLRMAGYAAAVERDEWTEDEERLVAFYGDMSEADKKAVITIAEALWRKTKENELIFGRRPKLDDGGEE